MRTIPSHIPTQKVKQIKHKLKAATQLSLFTNFIFSFFFFSTSQTLKLKISYMTKYYICVHKETLLFDMGICLSKSNTNEIPFNYDHSPPYHHYQPRRTQQPQQPRYPYHNPNSDPSQSIAPSSSFGDQQARILDKPYFDINVLYTLERELGRDEISITRLCTEKTTRRKYACESIPKQKLSKKKHIDDTKRQVLILQHLSGQPNIVEFKVAYEDRQNVHLVMELCLGGTLFDRITAKGSYSESEAASIFRQIVNVVHACHFMGVMHRDLKPENFLLASKDPKAPLKATNFGLSVFIEEGHHFTRFCIHSFLYLIYLMPMHSHHIL